MPKESVRSWSYALLIAYHKMFTKKLLPVHPGKVMRRKKRKKTTKAIAKLFALNANAKISHSQCRIISFSEII